jgi:hypothetical protein
VAAAAAVVVVGGVAVLLEGSTGRTERAAIHKAPVRLPASTVQLISSTSSTAMASSGTAEVTETDTIGSAVESVDTTNVTFSGQDLDFAMSETSYPPGGQSGGGGGATHTTTNDDRLVDGQVYLYIVGPDLQKHWYHDTGSDALESMTFPDPRTLMHAISPVAELEVVGQSEVDGVELTHLRAANPSAVGGVGLGEYGSGSVTSFNVWVDSENVVHQIAISSSVKSQMCVYIAPKGGQLKKPTPTPAALGDGKLTFGSSRSLPPGVHCGLKSMGSDANIQFANLGKPETVTVPVGAVDVDGLG